jgi:hexokinase
LIFGGDVKNLFSKRYSFLTKFLSTIESEESTSTAEIRRVLVDEMKVANPSDQDCVDVRYVCECISRRSAHLVSAALSALTLKMGDPNIAIGVDGSVYRFHPKFHSLMVEKMKELLPKSYKFKFVLSEDGSGRGAALVAAVAMRGVQA